MNRINYVAVVVSGIVYWLLQAGWYTALSGPYIRAFGYTPEQVAAAQQNMSALPYVTALVSNIIVAYVISAIMIYTGTVSVKRGVQVALVCWMGFVATNLATQYGFEQRPFSLFAINGGSTLLGMLAIGVIVGAWQAKSKA